VFFAVPKRLTTTLISSALGSHPPRAILWDMDGVLADVSTSYRRAIVETAAHFGAAGMRLGGLGVAERICEDAESLCQ
jgi:phosphoglycolate phosphatase-like HAD superfamily hydrolase